MDRTYAMWATRTNTRGSRGNDPGLERYLRNEYRGGMTVAELDGVARAPRSTRRDGRREGRHAYGARPSGQGVESLIGQLRIRAPMPLSTNLWKGRVHA